MSTPILNRDFTHPADGWYQIEPKGEHPNRAAGVVQVIDDEAAQSIANRFNADAAAGDLRHGNELLICHEHFSGNPDQETRAYGWLQALQNRADGVYGQIRWTKTGKEAVDGGDYRFFSTEYDPADLKVLNGGGPRRVRPLRLDGLSLTNMNNNRGQKPITNASRDRSPGNASGCHIFTKVAPNPRLKNRVSFSARRGNARGDIFQCIVALVRNRTGADYHRAFNEARAKNAQLLERADDVLSVSSFHRLLNRSEKATGLAPSSCIEKSVAEIQALTNRFFPTLAFQPTVNQWEALWRSAVQLEDWACRKLSNRADGVSASDWKAANACASDVYSLLETKEGAPVDRGPLLANAQPAQVRGLFTRAIRRLMDEQQLNFRQAFDKLKEDEPIFWTLAVLAIDEIGVGSGLPEPIGTSSSGK